MREFIENWIITCLFVVGGVVFVFSIVAGFIDYASDYEKIRLNPTKCVGGYTFINTMTSTETQVQIFDDQGHGIKCEVTK